MRITKYIIAYLILFTISAFHDTATGREVTGQQLWGVAISIRAATIPYASDIDSTYDIIPLFYYEKNRFFINGLESGFRIYDGDRWCISALGRYRFFDIPAEYQNDIRGNSFDLGGQARHYFSDYFYTDLEVLSDYAGRVHSNAVLNFPYSKEKLELLPSLKLRWKSSSFNNVYYGLNIESPGSALDFYAGLDAKYQVYMNFYLVGRAGLTVLDDNTYHIGVIDKRFQGEVYFGIGFLNDQKEEKKKNLSSKPYFRLAHGWATPSSLADILTFNNVKDPYNNQMTSLFYGLPVSDHIFGVHIPVYLTPGVVLHHESEVQDRIAECVLAMKFYYTIKWPIKWRLGFAEGISYVNEIPYVEQTEMERKGYNPSRLLNYLDLSLDIELGDLFRSKKLKDLWLGYGIHHRSGIFNSSSAFGRAKGGSNFNSIYLQYHW